MCTPHHCGLIGRAIGPSAIERLERGFMIASRLSGFTASIHSVGLKRDSLAVMETRRTVSTRPSSKHDHIDPFDEQHRRSKIGMYERACLCRFVSSHRRTDAARISTLSMAAWQQKRTEACCI